MTEAGESGGRDFEGRRDWVAVLFFGIVALLLADSIAQALIDRMHSYWNWDGQRLAPVFAVYEGYSLYPRAGEGPPVGYSYGPLSVFAYLPVVAAPDPTRALLSGGALSLAYTFLPVLGLLILGTRGGAGRLGAVALGMLLFAIRTRSPALAFSTMSPAHDAVALGLGLMACLPLLARERIRRGPLALSAALAVLSLAAKQNAACYLPTLTLYCLIAFGARAALGYAAFLGGMGLAVALVLVRIYGGETLAYYLVHVQAGLSRIYAPGQFLVSGTAFAAEAVPSLLMIGAALYLAPAPGGPRGRFRVRLARHPWLLPLLVGLGNAPISLMGAVKKGGAENSLSFTLYFLAAAAALLFASVESRIEGPCPAFRRRAVRALAALACTLWIMNQCAAPSIPIVFAGARTARRLRDHPNQMAYRYAKAHPGRAYFPWNCLAVLMAEHKLYATEDAILSVPPPGVSPNYLAPGTDLPRDPEYVAYPPRYLADWGRYTALKQFPRHRRPVEVPGLEQFAVFARDPPAGRGP